MRSAVRNRFLSVVNGSREVDSGAECASRTRSPAPAQFILEPAHIRVPLTLRSMPLALAPLASASFCYLARLMARSVDHTRS